MRRGTLSNPGALRRWWWRESQRTLLGTTCLGTTHGLVVSGVVLSGVDDTAAPAAAHPAIPATSWATPTGAEASGFPSTPSAADDLSITVTAVPAVDLLDGVDTTTNRPVAVRVLGIRSTPPCWADQALASAAQLLRGKQVWLVGDDDQAEPDGRVRARVLLPDGHDYAHAVVSAGAAQPDASLGAVPIRATSSR
jgi:endonuclease YncB( thermonuclease family)